MPERKGVAHHRQRWVLTFRLDSSHCEQLKILRNLLMLAFTLLLWFTWSQTRQTNWKHIRHYDFLDDFTLQKCHNLTLQNINILTFVKCKHRRTTLNGYWHSVMLLVTFYVENSLVENFMSDEIWFVFVIYGQSKHASYYEPGFYSVTSPK